MKRLANLAIVVEDIDEAPMVNELLHEYRGDILGRMGLPLREYGVSFINVVLGASEDEISALSGRLGRISSVQVKVSYSQKQL